MKLSSGRGEATVKDRKYEVKLLTDANCKAEDADASDYVLDEVWLPRSDESWALTVFGIVVR